MRGEERKGKGNKRREDKVQAGVPRSRRKTKQGGEERKGKAKRRRDDKVHGVPQSWPKKHWRERRGKERKGKEGERRGGAGMRRSGEVK